MVKMLSSEFKKLLDEGMDHALRGAEKEDLEAIEHLVESVSTPITEREEAIRTAIAKKQLNQATPPEQRQYRVGQRR